MAKITIKELESLTANDASRILGEDGNLAGRISARKDGVSVSFSSATSLPTTSPAVLPTANNAWTKLPEN